MCYGVSEFSTALMCLFLVFAHTHTCAGACCYVLDRAGPRNAPCCCRESCGEGLVLLLGSWRSSSQPYSEFESHG